MNESGILRPIDVLNADLRAAWTKRYCSRAKCADMRGDAGQIIDQDYAMKRMLARALLQDIKTPAQAGG